MASSAGRAARLVLAVLVSCVGLGACGDHVASQASRPQTATLPDAASSSSQGRNAAARGPTRAAEQRQASAKAADSRSTQQPTAAPPPTSRHAPFGSQAGVGPPRGMPQEQQPQHQSSAAAQAVPARLPPRTGDNPPEPASPPPPAGSNQTQRPGGADQHGGSCSAHQHSSTIRDPRSPQEVARVDALVKAAEAAFASSAMAERDAAAVKAAKIRQAEVSLGFVKRTLVSPHAPLPGAAIPLEPPDPAPDDGGLDPSLVGIKCGGAYSGNAAFGTDVAVGEAHMPSVTCQPDYAVDQLQSCFTDDGALSYGPWHLNDWRHADCDCGWGHLHDHCNGAANLEAVTIEDHLRALEVLAAGNADGSAAGGDIHCLSSGTDAAAADACQPAACAATEGPLTEVESFAVTDAAAQRVPEAESAPAAAASGEQHHASHREVLGNGSGGGYMPQYRERFFTADGSSCAAGSGMLVVSLEGLDRLVLELQNATVGRSLHMCLQTALLAPPSTLVIAVQTCLLEHNVVGDMKSSRVCTVAVDQADGYHKLMCRAVGGAWACAATSTKPPRVRCKWGPLNAPASFRGYNAALMQPGQEDQWRDALARMHQGVQFLQLDRLCERQPVAVWNPHEPPPPPVCGDGGHSCEAGLPGAVGVGMQLPPKEPPPRSAVWRSPWGGGTLFPDPATGGCQECADRQLASDLAAARLRTHEPKLADTEVSWGLLAAAALAAAAAAALTFRRHLAAAKRGWRRRPSESAGHPSVSHLRSAAAAALRDATVSGNPQKLATAISAAEELGVSESLLAKARLQLRHKTRKATGRDRHAAKERQPSFTGSAGAARRPVSGRTAFVAAAVASQPVPHIGGGNRPGSPASSPVTPRPSPPAAERPRQASSQGPEIAQQPSPDTSCPGTQQQRQQSQQATSGSRSGGSLRRASAGSPQQTCGAVVQAELLPAPSRDTASDPASPASSITPTRPPSSASGSTSLSDFRTLSGSAKDQLSADLAVPHAAVAGIAARPRTPSAGSDPGFRRGSSGSSGLQQLPPVAELAAVIAVTGETTPPANLRSGSLGPWGESSDMTAAIATEQAALRSGSYHLSPAEIADFSRASAAAAAAQAQQQEQAPEWDTPQPPPLQQLPLPQMLSAPPHGGRIPATPPTEQPPSPLLRPDDMVVSTPPKRRILPLGDSSGGGGFGSLFSDSAGPLFSSGGGGGGGSFKDSAPRGLGLAAALEAGGFLGMPSSSQPPRAWGSADGGVAIDGQQAMSPLPAGLQSVLASQLSPDAREFQPPASAAPAWSDDWLHNSSGHSMRVQHSHDSATTYIQRSHDSVSSHVQPSHDSVSSHVQRSLDAASTQVQRSGDSSASAYLQRSHDSATTYVHTSDASHSFKRRSGADAAADAVAASRRLGTASTESLALPEESVSPFFGRRPMPAGYQGPLPVFSMPQDPRKPPLPRQSSLPRELQHSPPQQMDAFHGGTYSPAAAQPAGGFRGESRSHDFVPFPGMIGPGWDAGDAPAGVPEFIPSSRGAPAAAATPTSAPPVAASASSMSSASSGGSAAKPLGLGLGLGAFGLGGSLWGAPPREVETGEDAWAAALEGSKADKETKYGGIGKAALSKLWE